MRYGADPLKQLMAKENRRDVKAHIKNDQLIVTIFLPVGKVLECLEELEEGRSLADKLRVIANRLDQMPIR